VETDWGRAQRGQPDDLVPTDVRATIDVTALQPGGATAALLGLPAGRRIGDWVNPQPVGGEHAMRGALAVYGGSSAYADQVLALAEPVTTSGLPVVLPIPAPGWVQRIPTRIRCDSTSDCARRTCWSGRWKR
jgi:hypothetical protein